MHAARRNKTAAVKLLRKLMKRLGFAPRRLVTDKLPSYGAAKAELGMTAEHEKGLRKNNRAENSHQPVRRRERKMQRFKSAGPAQRFLALHAAVYNIFNVQRHLISRRPCIASGRLLWRSGAWRRPLDARTADLALRRPGARYRDNAP